MKNFDVQALGLEELSQKEAKKVNGGSFFILAGIGVVLTVMTVVTIVKVTGH